MVRWDSARGRLTSVVQDGDIVDFGVLLLDGRGNGTDSGDDSGEGGSRESHCVEVLVE